MKRAKLSGTTTDAVAAVFSDHFARAEETTTSTVSGPAPLRFKAAASSIQVGDLVAFPPSPPAAHFKPGEAYTVVRVDSVVPPLLRGVRLVHSAFTAIGPQEVDRYFATTERVERSASDVVGVLADPPAIEYAAVTGSRFTRVNAPLPAQPTLDLSPGALVYLDSNAWSRPEVEREAAREEVRKAVAERKYDERAADPVRYPYVRRRQRKFKYPGQHDGTAPYCLGRVLVSSSSAITVRKLERGEDGLLVEGGGEIEVPVRKVLGNFCDKEEEGGEFKPLKILDVFAGCGGLSEGLRQSGFAKDGWAIEMDAQACATYKANHPDAVVLQEDCTDVLARAMRGEKVSAGGGSVPQKGEVDVIAGGPPCQGYSTMNRYSGSEKYRYRNSLVATFVSYCDFYRPKAFILENVPNLASINEGRVLGLVLQSLLGIGYQVTFAVLQAGRYGAPQCRRRFVLVAVPYDAALPQFPAPTHTFSNRYSHCKIDTPLLKVMFGTGSGSGIYPRVTIRDAIGDLATMDGSYSSAPASAYQRRMRENGGAAPMDHAPRHLTPVNQARVLAIHPDSAGADWRDLPNDVVLMVDGTYTKRLVYDPVTGAVGDVSQRNTLIPWTLAHTADRNSQWAGNCGRLNYDGFFLTALTRPEMLRKQGTCLHPELDRIVTARECARGQGFPDSYVFKGTVVRNCMQIGNAVSVPMARALGNEFKKYF